MITAMKKYYCRPASFVGQKRMFASEFRKVLKRFSDRTVFVDLFGGSGLLSHITKRERPDSTVIYNDHDNYRERLENISRTNALLPTFAASRKEFPPQDALQEDAQHIRNVSVGRKAPALWTISPSLPPCCSPANMPNIGELGKLNFYNNMRLSDYCEGLS